MGPDGPTTDFTDLHAWAEVYLPGAGWIGLDATSGLMAGEGHIPLAATPEPLSAAPISGLVEKADVAFGFEMRVTRIRQTPRTTKPYADRTWQDIQAAGARVDTILERHGVRMTMGGEPTFVSATDMEAPEWNTDAMGPTKRAMAGRLMRRLAPLWAPGAVLHHGMGKLYPGEQLPRWTLSAHWRLDGEPVWTDPALLASDDDIGTATPADAARFAAILAERLQVDPSLVLPAHEDIHYYLWREKRLPANVVAEDAKLRDPLERKRLARVFGQGLAASVGSVLPLRRVLAEGARRWQSGAWFFQDADGLASPMFLIPGDSPIGLRLPLDSLAWAKDASIAAVVEPERDPFAPVDALPSQQMIRERVGTKGLPPAFRPSAQALPEVGREEPELVRTALAVEPRDGLIHVFCPPLVAAEDWLELVAAIEATAAEMGQKIFIEGYLPPSDDRLQDFSVTPDPGVLEVNIHPMTSFAEQVSRTETLYEEARQVGLATQKFMLDGRHVGTGGGNHVVMGGATVEESPFLRRPDLLKSLVGFFQNHPSLSFLFSGLFIGPTSQHPRVDEARMDTLNELEIAFSRIKSGQDAPPWMVDRLFRHLLADMTGNTHRTEFCIDKMFSPDGPGGRRGLVEFRAFEMPPHAQMSAAQMLLMRSAVAAFWQRPWDRRLVRWGTRLHDEFLLPHYCMADFRDALAELSALGTPLDPAWFAPHAEFRFPLVGETTIRDVHLELRHALEPWHVLPEENTAQGTVRYVDSSAERLQVKAMGFIPERHALAVNGRAVPLWATETAGEYVAGVRFKAWSPPSSLHPTIAAQTPLVFDLYDRWTGRSLGGMSHHVVHPGGRSYDTFPVNANEAEARRRSRFFAFGHTPGPMAEPRAVTGADQPRTLDLRRGA